MELYGKNWPKEYAKRFFVGMHMLDKDQNSALENVLGRFNAREFVGAIADAGCDTLYFYMACHMGNCYYPTKIKPGRVFSWMKGRDFFGEVAAECVRRKIALVAVYEFENMHFYMKHEQYPREWFHFKQDQDGNTFARLCWNGGYGEFVLEQVKEVAARYPVAGFYIDMLDYPGRELCPGCAERFRKEMGKEPPDFSAAYTSPLYKEYRMWTFRETAAYLARVRKAVQEYIPGATVVNNCHYLLCEDLYQVPDANSYVTRDPDTGYRSGLGTAFATKVPLVFRALSEGKGCPPDILYDNITLGLLQNIPLAPFLSIAANAWAQGGWVCTCSMWALDGRLNPAALNLTREVNRHVDKVKPWVGGWKSIKTAGVYLAQESDILYANPADERTRRTLSTYEPGWHGAAMALEHEHVLCDFLTRRQLCRLGDYKVIYLPNAVCLSEREAQAFRDYVEKGGTLVASYRSSLADEWGNLKDNFQLADVFGVDYSGCKIEPYLALQMMLKNPETIDLEAWENPCVTVDQPAIAVRLRRGAKELVTLHERYEPSDIPSELPAVRNAFIREKGCAPAMVENHYGKGRCIYFAPRIFHSFADHKTPEVRKLVAGRLLEREFASAAVRLGAPGCVKLSAFERPQEGCWIIHLVNNQSNPGDTYRPKHALPLTDFILPVHNLALILNTGGRKVKCVSAKVSGDPLAIREEANRYILNIPSLHIHEVIVVDFTKKWESAPENFLEKDPLAMIHCPPPAKVFAGEKIKKHFTDNWNGMGAGQG